MIARAVNDNLAEAQNDTAESERTAERTSPEREARVENVVSVAVLVATAFRLRDEDGLLRTLRRLTEAVDAIEDDAA